ncbi:hypothetical protein LPJ78_000457 [Coemansia sp. RSA 989]|nr:hypothetical protein LPJ68_000145 [Coemansia sp. RSA 1086]KAJ1753228.1 hypothetical protein LPJ79_000507 [Coemansia sp. RSA 1821]KAJ1868157.1 hypothetical protein LPJ78_000457 [Coemansia sp. RSA 989]KAJ1872348.1 hypothetical protein LPJ55_003175 [Coemansia sp. RSA 990]KAJ2676394.1 hypothetical protein IWW42_000683 [Coemansia sp. RSA 1085]
MVAAATENTALLNTSHSATDRKPANFSRRSLPPPSSSPERPSSRSSSSEYNSSAHGERKPLTSWQLMGMTVLLAGIQFVWTVELGYGTPYLLSLGLSKPLMTLVWMAGPLSGLLIQPIVGRLSDKCASSLGRRRPYIIGGAAFVITSVIMIAYAKEAAVALARLSGVSEDNGQVPGSDFQSFVTRTSIVIAVVGFYVLDFSINTSQACARALALDIPPLQQQDLANAYAGRMLNLGSVTGYMVGFMDLRAIIPWKTDSQMQALCLIATAVFAITITWTCLAVREVPLQVQADADSQLAASECGQAAPSRTAAPGSGEGVSEWADMFGSIVRGVTKLPTPVQRVCNVQFFAWVAWFPFLFFATTWVTEVMSRTGDPKDPEFIERATRAGSFALFLYSIASLGFSMILPAFVEDESNASSIHNRPSMFKVSLRTMWRMSLTAMCVILMMTYFVADVRGATILIVSMAFPWALAMWAPFALVGEYVAIASEHPVDAQHRLAASDSAGGASGIESSTKPLAVKMPKHSQLAQDESDDEDYIVGSHTTANNGIAPSFVKGTAAGAPSVSSSWRRAHDLLGPGHTALRGDSIASTIQFDDDDTANASSALYSQSSSGRSPLFLKGVSRSISSNLQQQQPMQFASEDYGSALLRYEDEEVNHTDDSQQQHEKLESGTILGIHNMYVVFPQFVINAVSSLVFAWLGSEPTTHSQGSRSVEFMAMDAVFNRMSGGGLPATGSREAVGWVLRIGGASALIAAMMTFMLFDRQRVRAYVVQQNN